MHTYTDQCVYCVCVCVLMIVCYVQMDTFSLMTIRQLVEVSSTPGLLSTSADVNQLLSNIPTNQLTEFYKPLSLSLQVTHTQDCVLIDGVSCVSVL